MDKMLKGKVALITGGSRGIGAAIAKRFAQEGADIAISYTTSPEKAQELVKEIEKSGSKAAAFKADQSDETQVAELVNTVAKKFGRIDILVNNAGVYSGGKIDDPNLDIKGLKRLMSINVNGAVVAVQTAVKYMPEGSRIILIGSVNGERLPYPGTADYGASKAAIAGYARGWARDLGPKKITVNVVQPGPIDTDMNPQNTDFAKSMKAQVALGRYGRPEEVAALVAFIAGPEASYITGTSITIDGGFNA